jgi:hypothetical protein
MSIDALLLYGTQFYSIDECNRRRYITRKKINKMRLKMWMEETMMTRKDHRVLEEIILQRRCEINMLP